MYVIVVEGSALNMEEKNRFYEERKELLKDIELDDISIISNTCIGGKFYNDFNHKFLSPTIDCYIAPHDFVKFCQNIKEYLDLELIEHPSNIENFCIGKLGDILIYFSHSNKDFKTSKEKWNIRKTRVNYNKIYVICTDRETLYIEPTRCSNNTIEEFLKIPYKKVMFTSKKYNYKDVYQVTNNNIEYDVIPEATLPSNIPGRYILEQNGFKFEEFLK